jgi:hypothetical protein
MKITPVRGLLYTGAICALAFTARAQIVEFRATINAAQEVPATTSPATGTATIFYNFANNTFDLAVSVTGLTAATTGAHVHEAASGVAGPVRSRDFNLDPTAAKTATSFSGTFFNVAYTGNPAELLKGNAYFNLHTTAFPGGEVRGQLMAISQTVRLYSHMTIAQEAASNPTLNFSGLNDFGGAIVLYNPATNSISLRTSIYNFNNTFNNSHFHEAIAGVNGGVVHNLGNNPNAGIYSNGSGAIQGSFDGPYLGDPYKLLTAGAYLNYHSNVFGGGELRGQVLASHEVGDRTANRFVNLSVRGFVGVGEQALITGIVVNGPEPVRVLITAKGPSLTALGVTAALANPRLALFDSASRQIAVNDDVGALAAGSELAAIPGTPRNTTESALLVVLAPGNYTAAVTSSTATGTGVALLEVYDARIIGAITQ